VLASGHAPAAAAQPEPEPLAPGSTTTHVVQQPVRGEVLSRGYALRVPEAGAGPRPLVVLLHGRYQGPLTILQQTGLGPLAGARGFALVAPAAVGGGWNAGTCCSTGVEQRVPDVDFLDRVVADAATRTPVDRSRVFVTGFSNGAMMAYRYGCERSATVAGVAPVAGAHTATADFADVGPFRCRPSRPVPLLHVHGALDSTVPYGGGVVAGSLSRSAPVRAGVQSYANAAGCGVPATTRSGATTHLPYAGCRPAGLTRLVTVGGLGHGWTRDARRHGYDTSVGVLDFFSRLPRR
jgi:polyhydroxybutyrate depolymerase